MNDIFTNFMVITSALKKGNIALCSIRPIDIFVIEVD